MVEKVFGYSVSVFALVLVSVFDFDFEFGFCDPRSGIWQMEMEKCHCRWFWQKENAGWGKQRERVEDNKNITYTWQPILPLFRCFSLIDWWSWQNEATFVNGTEVAILSWRLARSSVADDDQCNDTVVTRKWQFPDIHGGSMLKGLKKMLDVTIRIMPLSLNTLSL